MRQEREVTNIQVQVFAKFECEHEGKQLESIGKVGMVQTPNGTYILDDDGVGPSEPIENGHSYTWVLSEKDKLSLINPLAIQVNASNYQKLEIAETQELSQFIRTFGNRLEQNFRLWKKALEREFI